MRLQLLRIADACREITDLQESLRALLGRVDGVEKEISSQSSKNSMLMSVIDNMSRPPNGLGPR